MRHSRTRQGRRQEGVEALPRGVLAAGNLSQIVCLLLVRDYRELIAYGAGWTDPKRRQPGGETLTAIGLVGSV